MDDDALRAEEVGLSTNQEIAPNNINGVRAEGGAGAAAKRQLGFAGGLRRNQDTVPLTGTAVEVAGFPSGGKFCRKFGIEDFWISFRTRSRTGPLSV